MGRHGFAVPFNGQCLNMGRALKRTQAKRNRLVDAGLALSIPSTQAKVGRRPPLCHGWRGMDRTNQRDLPQRAQTNIDMNISASAPETSQSCNLVVIGLSHWE
jgi:hypothetical protein